LVQSNECSVCYESYTEETFPVVLACGHIFCNPCVQQIVATANGPNNSEVLTLCPADRQPFEMTDVRRIYNTEQAKTPREKLEDVMDELSRLELENNEFESTSQIRNRLVDALQTENRELIRDLKQQREANEQIVVGNLFREVTLKAMQNELTEKDKKYRENVAKKDENFGRLQQLARGYRKQVADKTEEIEKLNRDLNQQREAHERAIVTIETIKKELTEKNKKREGRKGKKKRREEKFGRLHHLAKDYRKQVADKTEELVMIKREMEPKVTDKNAKRHEQELNRLVNALKTVNQELNRDLNQQKFEIVTFEIIKQELTEKDKKNEEDAAEKADKYRRLQQLARSYRKQVVDKTEEIESIKREMETKLAAEDSKSCGLNTC